MRACVRACVCACVGVYVCITRVICFHRNNYVIIIVIDVIDFADIGLYSSVE